MTARHSGQAPLAATLLAVYLVVLALLVFLPSGRVMDLGERLNLELFETINRALRQGPGSSGFRLMIGNVAAFVPFGLLAPLAVRTLRQPAIFAAAALALSLAIEIGQLGASAIVGHAYRSTDVDDVVLNVLGAGLGYGGFLLFRLLAAGQRG